MTIVSLASLIKEESKGQAWRDGVRGLAEAGMMNDGSDMSSRVVLVFQPRTVWPDLTEQAVRKRGRTALHPCVVRSFYEPRCGYFGMAKKQVRNQPI